MVDKRTWASAHILPCHNICMIYFNVMGRETERKREKERERERKKNCSAGGGSEPRIGRALGRGRAGKAGPFDRATRNLLLSSSSLYLYLFIFPFLLDFLDFGVLFVV